MICNWVTLLDLAILIAVITVVVLAIVVVIHKFLS